MKKQHSIPQSILMILFMSFLSLIFLFPLFWMVITALKRPEELCTYPITIFPPKAQWIHFRQVIFTNEVTDFFGALRNTFAVALSTTTIVTISSALAGFGFARYNARGKNFFFAIVLSTMMVPLIIMQIPQYIIFSQLGILSLPWPLCYMPWWLTAAPGWAIFIFYYRQFFATLPKELEDAAVIDGCGRLRTFWQIFMPLAGPAVTTVCIFAFQWSYSDYVQPLLYLIDENQVLAVKMLMDVKIPGVKYTLPLPPIPYQMTVGVFYMIPLVILFFGAQRYFMQGIATTGLKS